MDLVLVVCLLALSAGCSASKYPTQLEFVDRVLPVLEALANGAGHEDFVAVTGTEVQRPLYVLPSDMRESIRYLSSLEPEMKDMIERSYPRINIFTKLSNQMASMWPHLSSLKPNSMLMAIVTEYKRLRDELIGEDDNLDHLEFTETYKLMHLLACPDSKETSKLSWPFVRDVLKEMTNMNRSKISNARDTRQALEMVEQKAIHLGSVAMRILEHVTMKDLTNRLISGSNAPLDLSKDRAAFQKHLSDLDYKFRC